MVLKNLQVILIYLGFIFGIKKFKKDKLSAIDFQKYQGYYRDILKNYSPAELSYIDKFEILPKNDIVATLLSLELKNLIFLDNTIQINSNASKKVSDNEKYVLYSIQNGKITNFNENEFITKVKSDAVKNGLLKESKTEFNKIIKVLILFMFFIAIMIFICLTLFNDFIINPTNIVDWKLFIFMFAVLLVFYLPISLCIYFYTYRIKMKNNNYMRTKKGNEVNEQLEGLKNFLKDFSLIHERDENGLAIWEDYMIYSVIFNQNTDIIENIWNKYVQF